MSWPDIDALSDPDRGDDQHRDVGDGTGMPSVRPGCRPSVVLGALVLVATCLVLMARAGKGG